MGTVADTPPDPVYDVVVVMGVLEYAGGGQESREPYVGFLRAATALLNPTGTLVLAIENRLGVRYLCGASEDHSGRPFESVEGYGPQSPARTFSRAELEELAIEAGLSPRIVGVFPDSKMATTLLSDELIAAEPSLAKRLARFPSPGRAPGPGRVANEHRVWSSLLDAGLGREVTNSFLLLGKKETDAEWPWPSDLLGAYYSNPAWRAEFFLETRVRQSVRTVSFERRRLARWASAPSILRPSSRLRVEGDDLVRKMAATRDDVALGALLRAWSEVLPLADDALSTEVDALPHNAVIESNGRVAIVDSKWVLPDVTRSQVLARAALITAFNLAPLTTPIRWPVVTIEGLVLHIGALLGLAGTGEWLPDALEWEARFQASLVRAQTSERDKVSAADEIREELRAQLARSLVSFSRLADVGTHHQWRYDEEIRRAEALLGEARGQVDSANQRADRAEALLGEARRHVDSANQRADRAEALLGEARGQVDSANQRADRAEALLAALEQTKLMRFSAPARRLYGRARRTVVRRTD